MMIYKIQGISYVNYKAIHFIKKQMDSHGI